MDAAALAAVTRWEPKRAPPRCRAGDRDPRPAQDGREEGQGAVGACPLALREFAVPPAPDGAMIVASGYGGICWTDDHLQQGASADPDPSPSSGTRGWASSRELGAGAVPDATGEPLRPGDTMMWGLLHLHPCGIRPPCRLHREPTLCENRRACGANRSASDGPALTARFDLANPVTAFPLERHAEAMAAGAAGW